MGLFSFLRKPKLAPAAKAALLVYLEAEVELAVIQTMASEEYNRAGAEALTMANTSSNPTEEAAAIQNLVEATSRYLEILKSVATRHTSIEIPPEGTDYFVAHEILYKSYVHWCEARLLDYSNAGNLTQAQEDAVSAVDRVFMQDKKQADKYKGKLLRTIGINPHELVRMMREARFHLEGIADLSSEEPVKGTPDYEEGYMGTREAPRLRREIQPIAQARWNEAVQAGRALEAGGLCDCGHSRVYHDFYHEREDGEIEGCWDGCVAQEMCDVCECDEFTS